MASEKGSGVLPPPGCGFPLLASDEINEAANHRGRKDAEAMPGQQERVRPPGLRATSPGPENRDAPEGRSGAV